VKISYVTDGAVAGIGAFVDNTRITTNAGGLDADGSEGPTSRWTIESEPEGQPAEHRQLPVRRGLVVAAASVTTADSVLLGYGIEQLASPADQADVLGRIMQYLEVD
jgi:hypothetical protein